MALEITPKEISKLEPYAFVDFLNHLISVECNELGVSPIGVKTSSDLTGTEGGIDALIEDAERHADDRWIPKGLSVWQFRTGRKMTEPSELKKEAIKPDVLKALASGGHYRVAISRICNNRMRERREAALRSVIKRKGLDVNHVSLLTSNHLADWTSEHPAILLLPYFRRPVGNCMRVEQWERNDLHQREFISDENRSRIIDKIRSFSTKKTGPVHVRVVGRRGVGKTRLVMEAMKSLDIRESVIYAQEPDHIPPEIWPWLRDSTTSSMIIVVDECSDEEALKLKEQADICQGRVRLATIGVGEPLLSETSPNYLFLEGLDSKSMTKMIRDGFKGLSEEQVMWIERLTAGYPKLAVACGRAVEGRRDIDVAKLTQTAAVQEALRIFLPDDKVRRTMQALSLLTRVGFEGDVAKEAKTLASFVEVPWAEFCDIVEQMRREGVVGKKGRYLYVTPDLLASWLAAALLSVRADEVRELLTQLQTAESRDAFFSRLRDIGTSEKAQSVIQELLSEQSYLTIEQLDSEESSRILCTLAFANPQTALRTLERTLGTASIERLRSFVRGRRNIVRALEYLKWFKSTFFGAARLLLTLAEAENEEYANNATGVWTSLFQLRLGGTEVPALDRMPLLDEAISSDSPIRRHLALKAIATLMSVHEIRTSGAEKEGTQPVPPEWHPKTFGEIWKTYRVALQLLDRAMQDSDPMVGREASGVLMRSARATVIVGLAQEIVGRLEAFTPQDDDERRSARDTVRTILQYEGERLKDDQASCLVALENKLAGTDFHDRLRRWVGQWSFGDWDIRQREGGLPPQDRAAALAEEAIDHPDLFRSELDWLVSNEAMNVGYFGKRFGQLDRDYCWLGEIVTRVRDGGRPILLASYLWGRSEASDQEGVCSLLDQWANDDERLATAVLLTTINLEPSTHNLTRLLQLVGKRWLQRKELNMSVWSRWAERLPIDSFEEFLNCMSLDQDSETVQSMMHLLDRRLAHFPDETERLAPFAWQLLEQDSAVEGTMLRYHWGELSSHLVKNNPVRIAETVISISQKRHILLHDDPPMKALAEATRLRPKEVWSLISAALLRKNEGSYRLQVSLGTWYVDLVPVEHLLAWASEHVPEGPRILAAITSPSGTPMSTLARQLLIRYGTDERVEEQLAGNLLSGAFTGSMADWLQSKLDTVNVWTNDSSVKVRGWAQKVADTIEERIRKWRASEEEENFI